MYWCWEEEALFPDAYTAGVSRQHVLVRTISLQNQGKYLFLVEYGHVVMLLLRNVLAHDLQDLTYHVLLLLPKRRV